MDNSGRDQERSVEKTVTRQTQEETSSLNEVSKNRQIVRQTITSLGPIMATIAIGATFGYSAVLLPQLKTLPMNGNNVSWMENYLYQDSNDPITVSNVEEESWIAASATLLMAPGCWLSVIFMERLGRRKTQMLLTPVFLISWLTLGFAPNFWVLIAGRLLSGFCVGLQSPLGPVYVAETSEPRLRGLLLAGISLAIAVGILISHVLGTWLPWRVAAHLLAIFPFLSLLFFLFSPESPAWLVTKNRIAEATEVWRFLRGNNAAEEFNKLESKAPQLTASTPTSNPWRSRKFLKPLVILNAFFFITQFSGVNAVTFYCVQMIGDVSGPQSAHYSMVILDVIRVAPCVLACWLTQRYPRRILALFSGAGTALSLLILSAGLIYELGKPWLPASMFVVYTCAVYIGLVPLPWLLCGEIFPVATRGLGSGLSSGFAFICFFVVIKTGPVMLNEFGTAATFFFYGFVSTVGTVFLYFFLPETKDKTLHEIEENFAGKSAREIEPKRDSSTP